MYTARRLVNENFLPAVVLEVVLYDWSRGSGYSGSYAAPGTSESQSAERRAEVEESGATALGASGAAGEKNASHNRVAALLSMDGCPCDPALLFRDGDVYEDHPEIEEEEEALGAGDLVLVRRDGKGVRGRGADEDGDTARGGRVPHEHLTAGDLACDVGGLDRQLEDITRRVLATRSLPADVRAESKQDHNILRLCCAAEKY